MGKDSNSVTVKRKCTRRIRKVKMHHVQADRQILYACYGNTAVDLDPLPVSRAHLTVVDRLCLSETCLK
jgi:hypothetical protein